MCCVRVFQSFYWLKQNVGGNEACPHQWCSLFLTIYHNSTARTREWVKEMRFVTLITWTLPVMLNVLWPEVAWGGGARRECIPCIRSIKSTALKTSSWLVLLLADCSDLWCRHVCKYPPTSWGLLKREDIRCKQEMGNILLSKWKPSCFNCLLFWSASHLQLASICGQFAVYHANYRRPW